MLASEVRYVTVQNFGGPICYEIRNRTPKNILMEEYLNAGAGGVDEQPWAPLGGMPLVREVANLQFSRSSAQMGVNSTTKLQQDEPSGRAACTS